MDSFVDIHPFLKDLNLLNNNESFKKLKSLKEELEEKRREEAETQAMKKFLLCQPR